MKAVYYDSEVNGHRQRVQLLEQTLAERAAEAATGGRPVDPYGEGQLAEARRQLAAAIRHQLADDPRLADGDRDALQAELLKLAC